MYGIFELLFGRVDGGLSLAIVVLRILGVLLMCASLFLLGRRNELGWWLAGAAFLLSGFSGVTGIFGNGAPTPASLLLSVAGFVIPLVLSVGVAMYGLLLFRKHPLESGLTRAITLKQPRALDFLSPLLLAVVYGAATMLSMIAIFINILGADALSRFPLGQMMLTGIVAGLLPAALLGLANRSRWAWFLVVAVSALSMAGIVVHAAGSVLIFLYLCQGALALYGWGRWGAIPRQTVSSSPTPAKPTF
ncbi:hypothetical protein ART_2334 [Arthrobacter sp. PAMC 25486]|uniref:hypothetical protein n=1 Tax=Arthrobacter sp. PAMC 25486 TaxID=1494608 RepID=UPI000535A388|nr:hypothetical protein [Arthrobacter sp. PAMC 25486]AIY01933.1 hypothetical protein ART_2334 [Arthrobacter sp. PAMC 25486]